MTAHSTVGKRTVAADMNGANVDQPQTFMNQTYTERQGQFLAYIHQYSILNGCAPAEADMQRFFQITPPSVHSMVLTLERRGFIQRVPGQARSIVPPESLPPLKRVQPSPFKP
jgi:DNA-binding MarR family transcriptional regulator